ALPQPRPLRPPRSSAAPFAPARPLPPPPATCRFASNTSRTANRVSEGYAPRPPLRHPVRAGENRSEDGEEPLLPGAALHRHGIGLSADPGGHARHEGGRRLGRGEHRILLDPPDLRRHALRPLPPLERRPHPRS